MIAGYPVKSILIVMQTLIQQQNPTWTAEMIQKETSERFKVMQEEIQEGNSPVSSVLIFLILMYIQMYILKGLIVTKLWNRNM